MALLGVGINEFAMRIQASETKPIMLNRTAHCAARLTQNSKHAQFATDSGSFGLHNHPQQLWGQE